MTGGKDFRGLFRFQRPVPATPRTKAYDAIDFVNTILTSQARGGGGIAAKAALDQLDGVIDWIHPGTLTSSGYLFHLTHALGTGLGGLIGLGVQGNGGVGLLIAKDGPKGVGLFIDQKGVVTDPAAFGARSTTRPGSPAPCVSSRCSPEPRPCPTSSPAAIPPGRARCCPNGRTRTSSRSSRATSMRS